MANVAVRRQTAMALRCACPAALKDGPNSVGRLFAFLAVRRRPKRRSCKPDRMALRNSSWSGALSTRQSMGAPASQISVAALPAGAEQVALVAALCQR